MLGPIDFPTLGWQVMFLVEGILASLGGIAVLFLLKDRPEQAPWLSADEKTVLRAALVSMSKNSDMSPGHDPSPSCCAMSQALVRSIIAPSTGCTLAMSANSIRPYAVSASWPGDLPNHS